MPEHSDLTQRLIRDGLTPKRGKLTDVGALVERIERAAGPNIGQHERRRMLIEAAVFIRERHADELTNRSAA